MMQHKTIAAAALLVSGLVSGMVAPQVAQAQDTGLIPVRVKIGAFLPQGDAKNFAGSTNFIGEVDVSIPNLSLGKVFVSAGYSQGSEGGNKFRMIPVTIGRYFAAPNPLAGVTGNVYTGAGLGAYFVRVSNPVASESKVAPGAFAVVGYQLPNKYFIEGKYHIATKVGGVRPSGLALMVGRSF
jgi:hypothetical protein